MSQRQIADALGITQPAVSQQLKLAPELDEVHPEVLVEAAAPILKSLAAEHGYSRLAVFGSVARHQARKDSDIDLVVEAPEGTSSFGFVGFKQLIEQVLGREIDLVSYGGLRARLMMKLGEAANRLSRLGVLAPDGVEWALAVANRNFIIHQYDEIDRELTWLTLSRDLPAWRSSLTLLFEEASTTIDDESH